MAPDWYRREEMAAAYESYELGYNDARFGRNNNERAWNQTSYRVGYHNGWDTWGRMRQREQEEKKRCAQREKNRENIQKLMDIAYGNRR